MTGSHSERLLDSHSRKINYLRLSITDRCNLRCAYCMPPGEVRKIAQADVLRFEEMIEVARVATTLGVNKVRITGGEPLVRRGVVRIVREISSFPGVETVAMTTNGTRLEKYVSVLKEAGLTRLNVSMDTLKPETYMEISRGGDLQSVLNGIDAALECGFPVKINTVLGDWLQPGDVSQFVEFALEKGVEVRFIEQMSFEDDKPYLPQDEVIEWIKNRHRVIVLPTDRKSSHVRRFDCDGATLGFISPRSHPFCSECNKLRLTPNGQLRACLASTTHVDVRAVLRRPHTDSDVRRAIKNAAGLKPGVGPWTARSEMWRVGG
ncbi:MAG: GTP 3',8-cyclase MoaA [Proteobacteria bacterium]|nr:GTP 3',8-cyclase MoaA [Pseudomonadota bacterium]